MIFVCIILWTITSHTSAQNTTESSIHKTTPLMRRQWPEIRFEDFYHNSGDGPNIEENVTESYAWITIVTQIKASIWPTITRIKISTPSPKPSPSLSPTPRFSNDLFSWGSSYGYAISSNSQLFSGNILYRSSFIYLGPSSSIEFSERMASNDIISISQLASDLKTNTITLSSQAYIPTKSVTHSDRLTEYFSSDKYSSQSSFEIKSGIHSIPRIDSSLETEHTKPIVTPFQSMAFTTVEDKNSIYRTPLSLSRSLPENMLSTPTPFIPSIETSAPFTKMTTSSLPLHSPSAKITVSKTIDILLSSKSAPIITSKPTPTPISTPLCPENVQTEQPKAFTLEKPIENYLIRTVLNNTSNESIANIKMRIEGNIRQIYIYAFGKQYEEINLKTGNGRKLQSEAINNTIDVKLWDLSIKNASQLIHVIYYVEKDGTLIPYEDALRTLSYISDDKYSQIIGIHVIEKVKPYNERLVAKSEMNWLAIILISCSGLVLIICIIVGLLVFCKYRSEKRKWIDAFHLELNRVVPDNQIHWRTVSHHIEPKSNTSVKETDSAEFQYVPFQSDKISQPKKIMTSRGIQSNLEMQKEKVIPIAKIIDDNIDMIETTRTTFVTTTDINTEGDSSDTIPRIIEVQISEQTQAIIRAIRNELNKFGSNSMSFNGSQPEGSIISNSSEA